MIRKLTYFFLFTILLSCSNEDRSKKIIVEDPLTLRDSSSGQIIGFQNHYDSVAWTGIPYAEAPEGELRWRAPVTKSKSKDVIKALENPNICFQKKSFVNYDESVSNYVGSEDCLYLNIHAPRNSSKDSNFPVMVWIHGGGNTTGTGNAYDFSKLASEHNLIIVTINYRLGPLGWFYHPSINKTGKSAEDRSGNFGLLDQIEALKWVQKNIKNFGGDKSNVTIFGESAGGHNVFSLISSPLTEGLFHRAISQSGSTRSYSLAEASNYVDDQNPGLPTSSKETVNKFLINKGQANDRFEAKIMQDSMDETLLTNFLQSLKAEEIHEGYAEATFGGMFNVPRILADGFVLPIDGMNFKENQFNKVPTMLGSNRDEMKLFYSMDPDYVRRFLNIFIFIKDEQKYEIENEYSSNNWKINGVDNPARTLIRSGNPDVYTYRFDWDEEPKFLWMDFSKIFGAAHGFEITFVTGMLTLFGFEDYVFNDSNKSAARQLSDAMMSYWAEFAYSGNPQMGRNNDLPKWDSWNLDVDTNKFIILDTINDKGIRMTKSQLFHRDELIRLAADDRIKDIASKCRYIKELKDSGNKSNYSMEECKK